MKVIRMYKLEREARKAGGDRYTQMPGDGPSINETFYVDQEVSRASGKPAKILKVTVETEE